MQIIYSFIQAHYGWIIFGCIVACAWLWIFYEMKNAPEENIFGKGEE